MLRRFPKFVVENHELAGFLLIPLPLHTIHVNEESLTWRLGGLDGGTGCRPSAPLVCARRCGFSFLQRDIRGIAIRGRAVQATKVRYAVVEGGHIAIVDLGPGECRGLFPHFSED